MKKIYKTTLIILISFVLIGCNNKIDNLITEGKEKVNKEIKKVDSLSKNKIEESINYVIENYDKKVNKDLIYHITLLKTISNNNYVKTSKIKELADLADEYIIKKKEESKSKLSKTIKEIKDNKDNIIDDFYDNYKKYLEISTDFTKSKTKLIVEMETKESITIKKLNKSIDYIFNNYKYPLRNKETTEKTIYYSMYLDTIGTKYKIDNDIIKLGTNMKKYIQEQDNKYITEIESLKDKINSNREALINEILAEYNKG